MYSLKRRIEKLEVEINKKDGVFLIRHEHIDEAGNLEKMELPAGFNSIEEVEKAHEGKEITWVVVRHVYGHSINENKIFGPEDSQD